MAGVLMREKVAGLRLTHSRANGQRARCASTTTAACLAGSASRDLCRSDCSEHIKRSNAELLEAVIDKESLAAADQDLAAGGATVIHPARNSKRTKALLMKPGGFSSSSHSLHRYIYAHWLVAYN